MVKLLNIKKKKINNFFYHNPPHPSPLYMKRHHKIHSNMLPINSIKSVVFFVNKKKSQVIWLQYITGRINYH